MSSDPLLWPFVPFRDEHKQRVKKTTTATQGASCLRPRPAHQPSSPRRRFTSPSHENILFLTRVRREVIIVKPAFWFVNNRNKRGAVVNVVWRASICRFRRDLCLGSVSCFLFPAIQAHELSLWRRARDSDGFLPLSRSQQPPFYPQRRNTLEFILCHHRLNADVMKRTNKWAKQSEFYRRARKRGNDLWFGFRTFYTTLGLCYTIFILIIHKPSFDIFLFNIGILSKGTNCFYSEYRAIPTYLFMYLHWIWKKRFLKYEGLLCIDNWFKCNLNAI